MNAQGVHEAAPRGPAAGAAVGARLPGSFTSKKKDVVYRAMQHLPRDRHTVEDLKALCREHPEFQPHAGALDTMLLDRRGRRLVQKRLCEGIKGKRAEEG